MNNLLEKFKAMETSQKILIVGAILCVLSIPLFLGTEEENENHEDFDSLETPDNRNMVEDYNSKLEAYDAERSESEQVSLDFNLDDYKNDDENSDEDILEKEIDSLMNENKREYTGNRTSNVKKTTHRSSKTVRTPSNSGQARNHSEKSSSVSSEFQNFFSSTPESKEPNGLNQRTDPFIYAVIHGDHTIRQGERVKLRLTKKAIIAGMDFSTNSYVYAFPTFQEKRVLLDINSINHVPVHITAFDTEDSAIGLYVKGAKMVGEITDEGSRDAVEDVDVGGVPVGQTIKNVFQRKQQVPTVTLLNNTKLILKPKKR
ncbi:hypothetical protein HME9304_01795 [Flagellimonas maritima]|uniref:Conjugative transposon TraM C-terminal domain-containing protein n=1 Tax=Flagellimonas maritima TaxID=1383885 RepID=A0A2Z4LSX7_9FLAO|nr:conjugative transposon protein TraM [Allomuricauda aurantiaca]AWX44790.1 hypothetical protein HME9304_01795 [Allomuricauda aurantiaca]